MRPTGPLLLAAALLLAGCVGDDPSPAAPAVTPSDEPDDPRPSTWTQHGPSSHPVKARTIPLHLNGTFPSGAAVCAWQLPDPCHGHALGPTETDLRIDGLHGNLTDTALTVTWNATSPLTERLGVGIMTMAPPDCADCPSRELGHATGTSPLRIDATDLTVPIQANETLHVYVYPESPLVDPVYVRLHDEQPFRLEGQATLHPPAT